MSSARGLVCLFARFLATAGNPPAATRHEIGLEAEAQRSGEPLTGWPGLAVFDPTSKPVYISHTATTRFVPTPSLSLKEGSRRAGLTSTLVAHPSR